MMRHDRAVPRSVEEALDVLRGLIAARFPDARVDVHRGEDPDAWWLVATVDIEDRYEVIDVFLDRLVDLRVEEEVPVFVDVRRASEGEAAGPIRGLPRSVPVTA